MFESVNPPRIARRKQVVTAIGSTLAHAIIVGLALAVPLLYFTEPLPKPPDMLAFVVASAPPPPPPPPPAAAPQKAQPAKPKVVPKADPAKVAMAVPLEAPASIAPERPVDLPEQDFVAGGVEGGVVGGIAGGIAGGIPMMPAPPPPPPPPSAPLKPVRIGGEIEQPSLLLRVNPAYPQIAINAKKEGIVILEATVDTNGSVSHVRVLRSEPLLDNAAVDAVKQWRYAPLRLNGLAHPFILTVTVNFSL